MYINTTLNQNFYGKAYNAVIRIEEGKIIDVIWDNTCAQCPSSNCKTVDFPPDVNNPNTPDAVGFDYICNDAECIGSSDPTCDPKVVSLSLIQYK